MRDHGCYSVKLRVRPPTAAFAPYCWTVRLFVQRARRARGGHVQTLRVLGGSCGLCRLYRRSGRADSAASANPGFVMNTIALLRENHDPTDDEIRAYLAGNPCRCSGV